MSKTTTVTVYVVGAACMPALADRTVTVFYQFGLFESFVETEGIDRAHIALAVVVDVKLGERSALHDVRTAFAAYDVDIFDLHYFIKLIGLAEFGFSAVFLEQKIVGKSILRHLSACQPIIALGWRVCPGVIDIFGKQYIVFISNKHKHFTSCVTPMRTVYHIFKINQ